MRSTLLFLATLSAGCTNGGTEPTSIPAVSSSQEGYKVEEVARGLEIPWAMAFTSPDRILVTERPGRVRVISKGKLEDKAILELQDVVHRGEGGLMDLTLHPDYADNKWVYLSYVTGAGSPQVVVYRYTDTGSALTEPKLIIGNIAAKVNHAGCRVRFGPDGKLYITTGEAFERDRAQDMTDLAGKTLRLNDDGTIPADNPFANKEGNRGEIWSTGHRNSQGIDWDSAGVQWQSEHGPSGERGRDQDEVNLVEKGKNYGWPLITGSESRSDLVSPLAVYTPAIAPGDLQVYSGKMFADWKDNLFVPGLRGECLVRITINGKSIASQERLFSGKYGRLRTIMEAPDGSLYFATSNQDGRGRVQEGDDKIFRIVRN